MKQWQADEIRAVIEILATIAEPALGEIVTSGNFFRYPTQLMLFCNI